MYDWYILLVFEYKEKLVMLPFVTFRIMSVNIKVLSYYVIIISYLI